MGGSKYLYTFYDVKTGQKLAQGTAPELVGQGYGRNSSDIATLYKYNSKADKPRKWRIERKQLTKLVYPPKPKAKAAPKAPKAAPKPKKPSGIPRISDPTPLQRDVHDLVLYNKRARKLGLPELSYGKWSARGKPSRP